MLVACTSTPTHYMGIDLSQPPAASSPGDKGEFVAAIRANMEQIRSANCAASEKSLSEECNRLLADFAQLMADRSTLERLPLVALARRAHSGDKRAQLELGRRFEEGRDVEQDLNRALKLYRMAAADTQGTRIAFVRGVGGAADSVQAVPGGPTTPGLAEAKERLAALKDRIGG